MVKKEKKTDRKQIPKVKKRKSLIEIEETRTGGQIALLGYDYQLMYSCYKALLFLDTEGKSIKLEGLEDLDTFSALSEENSMLEHVQLKHSNIKQDTSFFDSILINFLEVYLTDSKNENRYFKLVYDMEIAKGNLSKLISNKLDKPVIDFWITKIDKIKKENLHWNWNDFDFHNFLKFLKFEKLTEEKMKEEIISSLIKKYGIDTGNEKLFIDSLFYCIFEAAKSRQKINQKLILEIFQNVKDDISKGVQNPAYHWFEKIDFKKLETENKNIQYYEGKKATPADIVNGLPIRRENIEKDIEKSIKKNKITVIKSTSGQGKTTLAWQVSFNLSKEFSVYKLSWCKDTKEINNIIEYIHSRSKLGEKTLIVLDNLDVDLKEWNKLAQRLEEEVTLNYRLLITTREDDWYAFAGDQSNLVKLKIITLNLNKEQAKKIYENLKVKNKVHPSILNWQNAWEKVEEKQVLIEYVYLLTHGEMLKDRLSQQIKSMACSEAYKVKVEVLRIISLADVIGIQLKSEKLVHEIINESGLNSDINEILESLENEFFIKTEKGSYIEGLHPIRSQHISDKLHSFVPITQTFTKLLNIVDDRYIAKLFSQIPLQVETDKEEFYSAISKKMSTKSYSFITSTVQGLFSGSILKYFRKNQTYFDKANDRGGLFLFLVEIGPWQALKDIGDEVKMLTKLHEITPENENINYLLSLTKEVEKFNIESSDAYIYTYYLHDALKDKKIKRIVSGISTLISWFNRLDRKFDMISLLDFEKIWDCRQLWEFEELSLLMYEYHYSNPVEYNRFIKRHLDEVLKYLKKETDSISIYVVENNIHINYVLLPQEINQANTQSVSRINVVCRFLPIYEKYITKGIKPEIELLKIYDVIDPSYKEMPIRNVKLRFHIDLTTLWQKSILSHYEFSSSYEWQEYWINIRYNLISFLKLNINLLETVLKQKKQFSEGKVLDQIRNEIVKSLNKEILFPKQNRPFEKDILFKSELSSVKSGYFQSLNYYLTNYLNIVMKKNENKESYLAMHNLKEAKNKLNIMQANFQKIFANNYYDFNLEELEKQELLWLDRLININDYYLNNKVNSRIYNRLEVRKWKIEKEQSLMKNIEDKINAANKKSEINFLVPKKVYEEENLTYLPIALKDIDIYDESKLEKVIYTVSSLHDAEINYIELIFINDELEVIGNGLKISTSSLKNITQENFNEENLFLPIPVEVTQKQLGCFIEKLKIQNSPIEYFYKDVDLLLLLLWKYHLYQITLNKSDSIEQDYLLSKNNEMILEIESLLFVLKESCTLKYYEKLSKIKKDVIAGNVEFTDRDLNLWLKEIIESQRNIIQ